MYTGVLEQRGAVNKWGWWCFFLGLKKISLRGLRFMVWGNR